MRERGITSIFCEDVFCSKEEIHFLIQYLKNPSISAKSLSYIAEQKQSNHVYSVQEKIYIKEKFKTIESIIQFLEELGDKLLIEDGNTNYADSSKIDEFLDITRYIHPYLLLAAKISKKIRCIDSNEILFYLNNISTSISEYLLPSSLTKQYAEIHCHYSGVYNPNISLTLLMSDSKYITSKIRSSLTYLCSGEELRLSDLLQFEYILLSTWVMNDKNKVDYKQMHDFLLYNKPLRMNRFIFSAHRLDYYSKILRKPSSIAFVLSQDKLFKKDYNASLFLFFVSILLKSQEMFSNESGILTRNILLFFNLFHIIRSRAFMTEGKGLDDFIDIFSHPVRYIDDKVQIPARSLLLSGVTHMELRLGYLPDRSLCKDIIMNFLPDFLAKYGRNPLENFYYKKNIPCENIVKFSLGFHFKRENNDYQHIVRNIRGQTSKMLKFYQNISLIPIRELILSNVFLPPKDSIEISRIYLDLRCLLRTLDIAGHEKYGPPELYAPFIQKIMSSISSIPTICSAKISDKYLRRPTLACHAGEDFDYLPTGMRRVYETINFLEYRKGDRIGHGLALGINPRVWFQTHSEIFLNLEEYTDTLLWLYIMAKKISEINSQATPWIEHYREKFIFNIQKLNKNSFANHFNLSHYEEAYHLRKFVWDDETIDSNRLHTTNCSVNKILYEYRKRNQSKSYHPRNHDDFIKNNHDTIVKVSFDKRLSFFPDIDLPETRILQERISPEECEFLEMIQDYLLRIIALKKIVIEVNPSSNLAISDFSSLKEHPIFRWNPPNPDELAPKGKYNKYSLRMGAIRTCISSDDPGLFSTNIQTEFLQIENTALSMGYEPYVIHDWLERIRNDGITVFEENYISPYLIL